MLDEINDLLRQLDFLNNELSSHADVYSEIKSIEKEIRLINKKIRNLNRPNVVKNGQEVRLMTPGKTEITIFEKVTEELDIERMKKDRIYEKYLKRKSSIRLKQRKIDEY